MENLLYTRYYSRHEPGSSEKSRGTWSRRGNGLWEGQKNLAFLRYWKKERGENKRELEANYAGPHRLKNLGLFHKNNRSYRRGGK